MDQQVRVLIADDQRSARQGLRALLSQCRDVKVVGEAANGQEAALLVAQYQPDVVLMDIQMPNMNGLEAIRHIKTAWPQIKIVALTMYGQYKSEALALGADQFLIKGCPSERLLSIILNYSRSGTEASL